LRTKYFLAADVARAISDAGAEVVGPASELDDALCPIGGEPIDLAVIEINLGARRISLSPTCLRRAASHSYSRLAATGKQPARHAKAKPWEKPIRMWALVENLTPR
jgi:hypothetical protein